MAHDVTRAWVDKDQHREFSVHIKIMGPRRTLQMAEKCIYRFAANDRELAFIRTTRLYNPSGRDNSRRSSRFETKRSIFLCGAPFKNSSRTHAVKLVISISFSIIGLSNAFATPTVRAMSMWSGESAPAHSWKRLITMQTNEGFSDSLLPD